MVQLRNLADMPLTIAGILSIGFWIADSVIESLLCSHQPSFSSHLFPMSFDAAWKRMLVVVVLLSFGYYSRFCLQKRKQSELQLRKELLFTQALMNTVSALVVVIDQNGNITEFNQACQTLTGYTSDEVRGKSFTMFLPAEEREQVEAVFQGLLSERTSNQYENFWVTKTGEKRFIAWSNTSVRNGSIGVQYVIGTGIEITQRKEMEEELRNSAESVKQFAYSVVHDLKSPTIGLWGLTQLLQRQYQHVLDDRAKNYCHQISETAQQVMQLIQDIYQFIEASERPPRFEVIALDRDIFQILQDEFYPAASLRNVALHFPESVPIITADKLAFIRIFRNLIENALKYGGAPLSEIIIGYGNDLACHHFWVYNNGTPIPTDHQETIFTCFHREAASKKVQGTGLGLAIVRELVQQHQGAIWVDSCPVSGTAFSFSISKTL